MAAMPDIIADLEREGYRAAHALREHLPHHHDGAQAVPEDPADAAPAPPQPPATAGDSNQEEHPMAFAAPIKQALDDAAEKITAIATDPAVDELVETALAAVHVPPETFAAAVDMLRAAEQRHAAAGTPPRQDPQAQ